MNTSATLVNYKTLAEKRRKLTKGYDFVSHYYLIRSGFNTSSHGSRLLRNIDFACKIFQYQFLSHYFGGVPKWRRSLRRLNTDRTLPDFCIIGGIKSGTSDLAVNILLHPNVMTPLSKEFEEGDPEKWREFYPTISEKQRHAQRYGLALCPYLSPYLHRTDVMSNLSRIRPDTKVVLVLRDPVKRFYSQWKWEVLLAGRKGLERNPFLMTFAAFVEEALSAYGVRTMYTACGFDAIETSLYSQAVAGWIAAFGKKNVAIVDGASYYKDRNACLQQIFRFVGLPGFEPPSSASTVLENPLVLPPPDDRSMDRLSKFFAPHNDRLWELIDERFAWR